MSADIEAMPYNEDLEDPGLAEDLGDDNLSGNDEDLFGDDDDDEDGDRNNEYNIPFTVLGVPLT